MFNLKEIWEYFPWNYEIIQIELRIVKSSENLKEKYNLKSLNFVLYYAKFDNPEGSYDVFFQHGSNSRYE